VLAGWIGRSRFGPRTGNSSGVLPGKLSGGARSPGSCTGVVLRVVGCLVARRVAAQLDCRVSAAVSPEVRPAWPFPVLSRSVPALAIQSPLPVGGLYLRRKHVAQRTAGLSVQSRCHDRGPNFECAAYSERGNSQVPSMGERRGKVQNAL
jgi:hypothetical protein